MHVLYAFSSFDSQSLSWTDQKCKYVLINENDFGISNTKYDQRQILYARFMREDSSTVLVVSIDTLKSIDLGL